MTIETVLLVNKSVKSKNNTHRGNIMKNRTNKSTTDVFYLQNHYIVRSHNCDTIW